MIKRREGKTVLIIEDEVELRNFASRVLELEGHQVLQAEDGDAGIGRIRDNRVSLVLLDLRLPGHDGWWVLEQVKSEPGISAIPVIVFTASTGIDQRARALALGAASYLVKPLSAASMKEAVTSIFVFNGGGVQGFYQGKDFPSFSFTKPT